MKTKKNKMTNKERDRQLNHIFQALYELSQELRMVRGLFENYLIWKKDVKKFTKYLQKEEERKSKEREAEQAKGSGAPKTDSKPS
jgi:hypothetical protein|tara:strand:- start:79 stop:333 length:255 start_codon:yes stop_codon:yes gene_type:complete